MPRSKREAYQIIQATVAAMAAILYLAIFWLAGQVSGMLSGHGWPSSSIGDVFEIVYRTVDNGGSPRRAWSEGAVIGPNWLVYALFAVFAAPTLYLWYRLYRLWNNFVRRPESRRTRLGFATESEVRSLLSADAVLKKAKVVRPSMAGRKGVQPTDIGFFLGRDRRSKKNLYASVEDVFIILAPPRQGKDVHFCAPFTIDAPGPCIVTSTRGDAFTNTVAMRKRHGKIHVFDPNGLTNWPERMRWSPVRGCEQPMIAANRSSAIILGSGFKVQGDSAYWVAVSISILRCYLHAAALSGKTVVDILRWSTQPANPEPFTILREYEERGLAASGWAGELEACATSDPKFRAVMWATLIQAMSCFSDPGVMEVCSPSPDEVFDLKEFLSGRNTLYVLGKEKPHSSVAPIVTAMLEDIFDETRKFASRMPGSRLDPPLTVELNEVAHIAPMPSLPGYMGDSGGFSIALHVYLQSLSQARSRWGDHSAMIMWDNAAVRVIMGGAGNVDDLEDISRLMGEERTVNETRTRDQGRTSTSLSEATRRVLTAEEIRTLPFGSAILVARSARPVEMTLTPWWKRPDADEIGSGKSEVEKLVLQYSAEADSKRYTGPSGSTPESPAPTMPPGGPPVEAPVFPAAGAGAPVPPWPTAGAGTPVPPWQRDPLGTPHTEARGSPPGPPLLSSNQETVEPG